MQRVGLVAHRFVLLTVLTILASLLVACPFRPQEKLDPAESGEITVYTGLSSSDANEYLQQFRIKYPGIKVNLVSDGTGIILERLLAEQDAPQADVVWGTSATMLIVLEWYRMLTPYAPLGIERVRPQFRDINVPPYWVGYGAWMAAFCTNTEKLAQQNLPIPDSWERLTEPVYEGQIAMPSPMTSGTGYLIVQGILQIFGQINGWDYLDLLDKNVVTYTRSGSQPCKMAAQGEVAIGISFGAKGVAEKQENPALEVIFPTEGSGWDINANALIKKDEIKPGAKTFLDWAISDSAMKVYARRTAVLAVALEDDPPPKEFPEDPLAQLLDKDFPWAAANRRNLIEEWGLRYDKKQAAE